MTLSNDGWERIPWHYEEGESPEYDTYVRAPFYDGPIRVYCYADGTLSHALLDPDSEDVLMTYRSENGQTIATDAQLPAAQWAAVIEHLNTDLGFPYLPDVAIRAKRP